TVRAGRQGAGDAAMTVILGIYPGIHGGCALLEIIDGAAPQLVDAIDVPTIGTGAKERIDVIALQQWLLDHKSHRTFIERAQAHPHQGASSGFKYGRATGSIEAIVTACGIPVEIIEPSMWKRALRLRGKDKEGARQYALQTFPRAHALLALKRHHN